MRRSPSLRRRRKGRVPYKINILSPNGTTLRSDGSSRRFRTRRTGMRRRAERSGLREPQRTSWVTEGPRGRRAVPLARRSDHRAPVAHRSAQLHATARRDAVRRLSKIQPRRPPITNPPNRKVLRRAHVLGPPGHATPPRRSDRRSPRNVGGFPRRSRSRPRVGSTTSSWNGSPPISSTSRKRIRGARRGLRIHESDARVLHARRPGLGQDRTLPGGGAPQGFGAPFAGREQALPSRCRVSDNLSASRPTEGALVCGTGSD